MFYIEEHDEIPLIRVKNILTQEVITKFYELISKYNEHFDVPTWSTNNNLIVNDSLKNKSLCSGKDIWFPLELSNTDDIKVCVPKLIYEIVENYLFHQGILEFAQRAKWSVFRLLPQQSADGRMHIITYGDGDYYNWHKDHSLGEGAFIYGKSPRRNNMFTMSMNFCTNTNMKGGDLLFMHNNKTVEIPFLHNSLSIFPSTMYHAATNIQMNEKDNWLNRRISCQFWLAGSQVINQKEVSQLKWDE
jgi:hypothetical protein